MLLAVEPGVWNVPGDVPGPTRFGPESWACALNASNAAVAVKYRFINLPFSMWQPRSALRQDQSGSLQKPRSG
jgi:hypothetical protein